MPFLKQPDPAVGEDLRRRSANAGHQLTSTVYMVVAHIEAACAVSDRDEVTHADLTAGVFGADNIARLVIVKNGLTADLAAGRFLHDTKFSAVVINPVHRRRAPPLRPRRPSFRVSDRSQSPDASGGRKTFWCPRASGVCLSDAAVLRSPHR